MGRLKAETKQMEGNKQMAKENKLFSIYGARFSKSKERVNVSIVSGDDDDREWGTISIKLEDSKKIKVVVKDGFAFIKVPFLEEFKKEAKKTTKKKVEEVDDEDLPF